jgi:hypothetical protein
MSSQVTRLFIKQRPHVNPAPSALSSIYATSGMPMSFSKAFAMTSASVCLVNLERSTGVKGIDLDAPSFSAARQSG